MTTPTSMGNHGGTVTSCSPYAYPGFAEICILLRTWSTVTPGTCELAFLIKKKKKQTGVVWCCMQSVAMATAAVHNAKHSHRSVLSFVHTFQLMLRGYTTK